MAGRCLIDAGTRLVLTVEIGRVGDIALLAAPNEAPGQGGQA